ncbi:MAG: cell division protein FtsQ/DivIB [Gammaproteobacteria bacterium]|nr:cell division protein FtsQ/DivIB [Gammaproteobacteria bacterium]
MNRFISFLTGFALTALCGSLLVIQYRPQFASLDKLVDTSVFERSSDITVVDDQLTKAVELFDATRAKLTESIREWEGIDVSKYLSSVDFDEPSFVELLARDQERVYDDISAIVLAQGMVVADVKFDENAGWTLTLDSGEQVILGDKDVATRLRRVLSMLDSLPEVSEDKLKLVDARYSNGIAFTRVEQPVVAME